MQYNHEEAFNETWNVLTDEANRKQNITGVNKFILISLLDFFLLKRHPKAYKYYVRYVRPIILRKLSYQRHKRKVSSGFIPYPDQCGSSRISAELFSEKNIEHGKEDLFLLKVEEIIENQVPSALSPFRKFVKPHIELNQHSNRQLDDSPAINKTSDTSATIDRSKNMEHNKRRGNKSSAHHTHQHSSENHKKPSNYRKTQPSSLGDYRKSRPGHEMAYKHSSKVETESGERDNSERSERVTKTNDGKHRRGGERTNSNTETEMKDVRDCKSAQGSTEERRRIQNSSATEDEGDCKSKKEVHSRKTDKRGERRKPKPPPGYPSAPPGHPTLPAGYPTIASSSSTSNDNQVQHTHNQSPPQSYPGSHSSQYNAGINGDVNNPNNHGITSSGLGTTCPPCLINGSPLLNGKISKVAGKIKEKLNDPEFQQQAEKIQKHAKKFISKQAKKILEK